MIYNIKSIKKLFYNFQFIQKECPCQIPYTTNKKFIRILNPIPPQNRIIVVSCQ